MTGFGYNINGFGVGGSSGGGIVTLTSQTLINGQSNYLNVTASDFVGVGGTIIIPTDFWVWSNDSTAALIVDVANCTIQNNGKIIGKGGDGGGTAMGGHAAIELSSGVNGVTIINASGSYIAGGGGGGGRGQNGQGGGGAGGSDNGNTPLEAELNASGANGWYGGAPGFGGGAGGGGAGFTFSGAGAGGGGGRILPGSGGAGNGGGGSGGSAGNAGGSGSNPRPGGGGGWGANGGTGYYNGSHSGGSGGKAIDPNGNSYTLSNSGTLYGATS